MLIHGDGFALYGTGATGRANMLLGVWAESGNVAVSPSTANPRAPGTHHIRIASGSGSSSYLRRVFGSTKTNIGFGAAWFFDSLPGDNSAWVLFQARDNANTPQFSVTLGTTGVISVRTGAHDGTVVADTTDPVLTAGAYGHVELFATDSGDIEIRVNGETVLDASGLSLGSGWSQYVVGRRDNAGGSQQVDLADISLWDNSGSVNNDFLGDVQWLAVMPTGDESASDWTRNTGATDFDMIDEATPDGDTTYIEATAAAQVSEFAIADVPANTSDVIAVITQPMARKTDAGAGNMTVSLLSSDIGSPPAPAESNGADIPLTTAYTYYPQVHETDPATGVRWTPSGFNAARLRFERTA